ncbi:erythrocyte vesicle protein 1, putative [Plasmodium berghei]|uniref:Erythrocyte vesicle protein 1, putative n=2 Tax=Plasmodium berghei TaxID=5821 RepID=A0A509AKI2_PLABA|nr:erythrocyte vesicle protein 1, putative [Plasmodium berghei ANKA]SCL94138.1 erythrocyte vesicle protein 1, putative [Plasmodium berghei]SCM15951.1 erythrocyte vesicle protein 1, putative [Plasmodium berghei]SCN25943.1 erythrocyte vesicle protein 1, putative [Plasmodium berghei]VUC56074.1 erythrocyte vesicle protein 1, putative [Plasmodium berghei ANKA]|eukprot:XP_034421876.1 erythrocyte vesicle protein 1, putative [Plasmodium berghei ANKA]
MNCCFVILINLILVFALNFDTYVLCIWTNETIQHRKLNRVNRILSNVKPDTSNDKKKETKSSNDSPKNYKGKKSHKKKGSSNDHIEMENSELKPSIECENKYTDDLLNESNGSGDFLHSVKDVAVKKNQCHSYIFNCFAKSRNDNDDDDEDSYKQKYTSENNLDIKSGDDPDEGHSKFWRIKKGSKRGSDTNPFKLDMNYLTRKKSSLPNYEFNLAMVTKFIDSNQKIIDLENENDTVIKDNMNRNSNTVRSRDLLLSTSFKNIDNFVYGKIITHLLGYAYIFYGHKININKLEKELIKDYYYNYIVLKESINNIPDEFKYSQNSSKTDAIYNLLDYLGIEKYYYGFNRNLHTFLFLAREFLQKEYALKKVYEVLPVDFELDRKELIEQIHDSTSGEKDIYEFSYKIFDPICSFLHAYNCFNLNYISNKLINNLRIKKSNAVITKELSKLTEYVQTTHFDIIEYLKDLTYYITNLFEYGHKENLYNELVIFYYSLFFDYYLDTLGKLLYITQIHLKYPFNEQIKNDLSTINARIKTHRDFVENEMIRFYHKYNISENLLECVTGIFSNNEYRVLILEQYLDSKNSNYLSLILLLFKYLKVFIFSMSTYSNLQITHSLLSDLEKKNVKYDEALDILTHHASFNIFDSAFFNKKKVI